MVDAKQTQNWNKEDFINAFSRSTDKPRMEYCEDQKGTMIYIGAVQGHSHGVSINPTLFSLKQKPLSWKEPVFHTGSSFNYKSI